MSEVRITISGDKPVHVVVETVAVKPPAAKASALLSGGSYPRTATETDAPATDHIRTTAHKEIKLHDWQRMPAVDR